MPTHKKEYLPVPQTPVCIHLRIYVAYSQQNLQFAGLHVNNQKNLMAQLTIEPLVAPTPASK